MDVIKEEEDYEEGEGATDIAMSFMNRSGKLVHIQLDGKISHKELKEAVELGKKACKKIYEIQKKALKEVQENTGGKN